MYYYVVLRNTRTRQSVLFLFIVLGRGDVLFSYLPLKFYVKLSFIHKRLLLLFCCRLPPLMVVAFAPFTLIFFT